MQKFKRKVNPFSFWTVMIIATLLISTVVVHINGLEMEKTKNDRIEDLKNDRDSWKGKAGAAQEELYEYKRTYTCRPIEELKKDQ